MKYARVVLLAALILLTLALTLLTVNVLIAGALAVSRVFLAVYVAAAVTIPICSFFLQPPSGSGGTGRRRAF